MRHARHTRSGGFTLLESMIAVAILGFGLLTLAVMQLQAISQGSAGRHTSDAGSTGRTYLEQVHRIPWAELDTALAAGGWTNPSWNAAPATVNVAVDMPGAAPATIEHSYNVQWRVTTVALGAGTNPCLRNVEVRVTWSEEELSQPKTLDFVTRRYNWGGASC